MNLIELEKFRRLERKKWRPREESSVRHFFPSRSEIGASHLLVPLPSPLVPPVNDDLCFPPPFLLSLCSFLHNHPLALFSPLPSFTSLFSSLSSSFLLPLPFSIFFLDSTGRRNVPPVCVACLNVNDGHGSCVYRRRFGSLGRR